MMPNGPDREDSTSTTILIDAQCPCCFINENGSLGAKDQWIRCDDCKTWYHVDCVAIKEADLSEISWYRCPDCLKNLGPPKPKRTSKRDRSQIDYVALDNGDLFRSRIDRHPFCIYFEKGHPNIQLNQIKELRAHDMLPFWASGDSNEWDEPFVVRRINYGGLHMSVPKDLTVSKVVELVGPDEPVEVMDVASQENTTGWTLAMWRDYYNKPPQDRGRVRNVISLEVSHTLLGDAITRPYFVRQLDLVDRVWPYTSDESHDAKPKVSLYCLMSVSSSYTDFHIDFSGSSVFYHLCQGRKSFLFIRPTDVNLAKYEKWCLSDDQHSTFFADEVKECYQADLDEGDSLFIPSGWIHAVFTPKDSVVIGGNFLSTHSLPMQLRVTLIEEKTRVPRKYRFPYFRKVLWLTALYYSTHDPTTEENIGVQELARYLRKIWAVTEHSSKPKPDKTIPKQIRKDVGSFLSQLENRIARLQRSDTDQSGSLRTPKRERDEISEITTESKALKTGTGI